MNAMLGFFGGGYLAISPPPLKATNLFYLKLVGSASLLPPVARNAHAYTGNRKFCVVAWSRPLA